MAGWALRKLSNVIRGDRFSEVTFKRRDRLNFRAEIPLYKGIVRENWLILGSMVGDQLASHAGILRGARFSSLPTSPKNAYVGG